MMSICVVMTAHAGVWSCVLVLSVVVVYVMLCVVVYINAVHVVVL